MSKFNVGDKVTIAYVSVQHPNRHINKYVNDGVKRTVMAVDPYFFTPVSHRSCGVMYTVEPCPGFWIAEDWFEAVPSAMQAKPAYDGTDGRWGASEPVTSHSPRKMSQAERDLIAERIETRRKIRGDFS